MDTNIAFWNLGNLFHTAKDLISDDSDITPSKSRAEPTQAAQVANLASVINSMFDNSGPDLLGGLPMVGLDSGAFPSHILAAQRFRAQRPGGRTDRDQTSAHAWPLQRVAVPGICA
jgi:hypothetical protein